MIPKHKVFISYHHANDQWYKEELIRLNGFHDLFVDGSVNTGDINDELPSDSIRRIIRDSYLADSTVTILLAGKDVSKRKHIDWELKSNMIDGTINKKSGILVINLPTSGYNNFKVSHGNEKTVLYDESISWTSIDSREEFKNRHPHLPDRIIDNLLKNDVYISIINWERVIKNSVSYTHLTLPTICSV